MDYTNHKLPVVATTTGLAAWGLWAQLWLGLGVIVLLAIIAVLIRLFFRRGK